MNNDMNTNEILALLRTWPLDTTPTTTPDNHWIIETLRHPRPIYFPR